METMALYLADRDAARLADMERSARSIGLSPTTVRTAAELAGCLELGTPRVLFLDPGFEAAAELVSSRTPRALQLVLLGGGGRLPGGAIRELAAEELAPPADLDRMAAVWTRSLRRLAVGAEREASSSKAAVGLAECGAGSASRRLGEQVLRVAGAADTTVLLVGPRGAGKETVARAVHRRSLRAANAFLVVPCNRPERELVAVLYGDALVPGGALLAPIGGTLYLREVTGLPRALQDRVAETLAARAALGEEQERPPRVIAGTERSLAEEVALRRFGEELFYRLNVLSVAVPALVAAREDILLLARAHLSALARGDRRPATLSEAAEERLVAYAWPGNQAELFLVLERAALLAGTAPILPRHLGLEDLDPTAAATAPAPSLPLGDRSLRSLEETLIRRVLDEEQRNRSRAARILGINRTTLYNKLRLYGIE